VASVRQALRIVKGQPELRKQLWDNVATLYDGLARQGFKLGPEHGPVVGVHLPDRETAIGFWRAMLECRHLRQCRRAAATPNGVSLLRCSLCAVHTREQLEHMVEVMTGIGRQMGVLPPPEIARRQRPLRLRQARLTDSRATVSARTRARAGVRARRRLGRFAGSLRSAPGYRRPDEQIRLAGSRQRNHESAASNTLMS